MSQKESEIKIGHNEFGQGYLIIGGDLSEPPPTQTPESTEPNPEPEQPVQVSAETAADLAQVAARATELVDDIPERAEKKELSEQEKIVSSVLEKARLAVRYSETLDSGDSSAIRSLAWNVHPTIAKYNSVEMAIKTAIKELRYGNKFNKKDKGAVGVIESGLYRFRKGHPELTKLAKEERRGLADGIFGSLRSENALFRDDVAKRLADTKAEFTFAELLSTYNIYKFVGRISISANTHAGHVHDALHEAESRRDEIFNTWPALENDD
jgi:hypothetical protein